MRPSVLSVVVIAGGLAIFVYGACFAQFKTPNAAEQLENRQWFDAMAVAMNQPPDKRQQSVDALGDKWCAQRANLLTPRDASEDLGAGLVLLGLAAMLVAAANRMRSVRDIYALEPAGERRFYLLAAITWLSFIPAEWCYYMYADARGDFPPFADVIGIPLGFVVAIGIVGLPIVIAGAWVVNHVHRLPPAVWSRPLIGNLNVIELMIWGALLLAVMVTAMGVVHQPPIVPSGVFTIYLLLCGRRKVAMGRASPQLA